MFDIVDGRSIINCFMESILSSKVKTTVCVQNHVGRQVFEIAEL